MARSSLNHAYRLIWSTVLHQWVVVSEIAKGKGKSKSQKAAAIVSSLFLAGFAGVAIGEPTGGVVTSGSGSISQNGAVTTINQTSQTLNLNWNTFNVAAHETVNFIQPSATALAINQILDTNGSSILGRINANGQVWLINPNGVYFGQGATINVGSLLASTLNPLGTATTNGTQVYGNGGTGSIINDGTINANNGYVAFIGNTVANNGSIQANGGTVALGAGSQVSLKFADNQLLGLTVDQSTLNNLAENKGLIQANGGAVLLSAGAKDSLLASVVNNEGLIEAKTVNHKEGKIMLMGGMAAGTTKVAGTLDASAETGDGGFIETSAQKVTIADGTTITTKANNTDNGQGQSGTWLIDPLDFYITAGSATQTNTGIGANTLSTNLNNNGTVTIATDNSTGTQGGDIYVNGAVSWSNNSTLTLSAYRNININNTITATGANGKLALEYGQGAVAANNTATYNVNAKVNLQAGDNFSTKLGSDGSTKQYKVITALGAQASTTGTDLQGINGNLSGNYVLGDDIDASATSTWNSNAGFNPLGNNSTNFTGTFDGLGHTVTGLTINRSTKDYVGLFGYTNNATLSNVGLVGGSVSGAAYVGSLVGYQDGGSINNAYATGSVSGRNNVGGLVGGSSGSSISNAYATGNVTGSNTFVGGLVGYQSSGSISNAYATGNVRSSVDGSSYGGLVGYQYSSSISNAYATGSVTAYGNVGGLVGSQNGDSSISNAYATGSVTGNASSVGGLVGYQNGSISNSFYSGTTNQSDNGLGTRKTTAEMQQLSTFATWDIDAQGGTGKVWRIYEGQTSPLLRSFLTQLNLTPDYDGSGTAQTNIGSVSTPAGADSSKILGTQTNNSLTLTSSNADGYVATADTTGLYSNQQGYDIVSSKVITTTGSAAGEIKLTNGVNWTNGTLNINGNVTNAGAINSSNGIFNLLGGTWSQISNSNAAFSVKDFRISGGTFMRFIDGDGTSNDPYQIADIYGLQGVGSTGMLGLNYTLANDINASGTQFWNSDGASTPSYAGFNPLGNNSTNTNASRFTGTFDGLGHTVTGLTINRGGFNVGLFGYTSNATLSNVGLVGGSVSGSDNVGSLVGYQDGGSISNAYATGTVSGNTTIGGLVGYQNGGSISNAYTTGAVSSQYANLGGLVGYQNGGTISNAYVTGSVTGNNDIVGGLVGYQNSGSISNAYVTGSVTGRNNVGGLVGASGGSISNAYATGSVSGNAIVGGLVGDSKGSINNAYATGNVTSNGTVGGLVGNVSGTGSISNAYATGSVTGNNDVGGLVGASNGSISNAYATGNVTGNNKVGGLVGNVSGTGSISNAYATGSVTGTGSYVGGLVGNSYGNISNAYATGSVTGNDYVGGLVGYIGGGSDSISNAYATGNVTGNDYVGGLVGFSFGSISNAYVTGSVTGNNDVGGLVGRSYGNISNAYATGNVTGNSFVGGLVGDQFLFGSISNSFYSETTNQSDTGKGTRKTTAEMQQLSTFAGWDIDAQGGTGKVWRIYEGQTAPLLRSFLTQLNLTPDYNGSGTAQTNIGSVSTPAGADSSKILGTQTNNSLTLTSPNADGYVATADITGLYSNQQGYDLVSARVITTTGSAAGDITLTNGVSWTNGTLNINGNVTNAGAISSSNGIFNLIGGTWSQLGALANFSVKDFRISGGTFMRFIDGDGTTTDPYQIADIYGLQGVGSAGMLGLNYTLANDIDASGTSNWNSGAGFNPLGNASSSFTGTFDGQSHTVTGLTINRSSTSYAGLFGYTNNATLSNVGLIGGSMIGGSVVGGLVGYQNGGTISNAYATGSVSGTTSVGGLVGYQNGGTISNAYATGSVIGGNNVGGLVGWQNGSISNAYATGSVIGSFYVGGLVGFQGGGTISNAYATGSVSGNSWVGGLVGQMIASSISNAYATGAISATGDSIGGLVGQMSSSNISNVYATGLVSSSIVGNVGGLVGIKYGGTINNGYFSETTGQSANGLGERKTTAEMQQLSTFANWDIDAEGGTGSVWRIYEGQTSPLLRSFLTQLNVVAYDGSGTALTDIGEAALPAGTDTSKVLGTQTNNTLTLTSTQADSYNASIDATGLYSTQQGYDIISTRVITTTGSAAGDITLTNGVSWTNGTLNINGNVTNAGAIISTNGIFNLIGGTWSQLGALANFSVKDFRISGGTFMRFIDGDGTTVDPYQIADIYGLQGVGSAGMLGLNYTLANDIDASGTSNWNSGAGFNPLGNASSSFTGTFDGQSHTVTGLTINRPSQQYVGLFGYTQNANLKNVALENVSVTGLKDIGALVGSFNTSTSGSITDSHSSGNVTAYDSGSSANNIGGLVGSFVAGDNATANMASSSSSANVLASINNSQVGGLIGYATSGRFGTMTVQSSSASGSVSGGSSYIGGLIGYVATTFDGGSTVSTSFATGDVDGQLTMVGGLVGMNNGIITTSYATGDVSSGKPGVNGGGSAGGLVGRNASAGEIRNSYATGDVKTLNASESTGGLVGDNTNLIDSSYAIGAVTGDSNVGGLVGISSRTISNAYATGTVTGINRVGGLVGYLSGTASNVYATGPVSGNADVGGLVGYELFGTVANGLLLRRTD